MKPLFYEVLPYSNNERLSIIHYLEGLDSVFYWLSSISSRRCDQNGIGPVISKCALCQVKDNNK